MIDSVCLRIYRMSNCEKGRLNSCIDAQAERSLVFVHITMLLFHVGRKIRNLLSGNFSQVNPFLPGNW